MDWIFVPRNLPFVPSAPPSLLLQPLGHALVIPLLWIPLHVGETANGMVNRLAKAACGPIIHYLNDEWPVSLSFQLYVHFASNFYRHRDLLVRRYSVVAARIQ